MNKKRVDGWILKAKKALEEAEIAENGKVEKSFRGQISAFGAAMVMGSFRSAVAFYTVQGEAKVEREKLLQAIYYVVCCEENSTLDRKNTTASIVFQYVCDHESKELKEKFIDASIAIKLAMNFFALV